MSEHCLLTPSAAFRWMVCTPSARLEAEQPDESSAYADEGTRAHAEAARLLEAWNVDPVEYAEARAGLREACGGDAEMAEAVAVYTDYVTALAAAESDCDDIMVERRLDISDWAPRCHGTADAIVIGDKVAHVIDLKYGKGVPVQAEDNPQLRMYALGTVDALTPGYDIQRVVMHIVQPRLGVSSRAEMWVDCLQEWGAYHLRPAAREAFRGGGVMKPGAWCRFCRVRPVCGALARGAASAMAGAPDPAVLDAADIARLLPLMEVYKSWASAVQERALRMALDGAEVPGYKVVQGRAVRRVTNPNVLGGRLLSAGLEPEAIYKPRELRGLGELEKAVGKRKFAELAAGCIERPAGKPALVADDDPREAMRPAGTLGNISVEEANN